MDFMSIPHRVYGRYRPYQNQMSIISKILSGDLMFADRAVLNDRVEVPKSFRQVYPRIVGIHVTNHLWDNQRW
jgi:hypothetical protein